MTNTTSKLTYETPELTEWGNIEDLTLGEAGAPGDAVAMGSHT